MLESHRGRDQGALEMAEELAARFGAPLFPATVSRLLIDLNRSLHHPSVFSELTWKLPEAERQRIVERHYRPHRDRVEAEIRGLVEAGATVVHLAVHSFTPVRRGVVREADVSLLYDPRRPGEKRFCDAWAAAMASARPDLRIRRNYPFKGISDGFTTYLRKRFPATRYLGIEIESNQRFVRRGGKAWKDLCELVAETLAAGLA